MPFAADPSLPVLALRFQSCIDDDEKATWCDRVYDWTGNQALAESADWLIAKPIKIAAIIIAAVVVRAVVGRLIRRLAKRAAEGNVPGIIARGRGSAFFQDSPLLSARRAQRSATMGSVLGSITTGVVASIAVIMVIAELGVSIAPLLASAGILGVALGFGAQSLVKDFLSGIFMILEDQYGVGDVIDAGDASGVVEAVGLRVTRLRDVNGVVWYMRNGEIPRVGNMSQGWARAVLDISVAYHEDIERVRGIILDTARELYADEDYRDLVLDEPEVWGVEALDADAIVVRLVAKVKPLQQWAVARALRERIKAAFDRHGVEIPFPQRTVWMRAEGPGSDAGAPTADGGAAEGDRAPAAGRTPAASGPEADSTGSTGEARRPGDTGRQPVRSEYTGEMPVVTDTDQDPANDIRGT